MYLLVKIIVVFGHFALHMCELRDEQRIFNNSFLLLNRILDGYHSKVVHPDDKPIEVKITMANVEFLEISEKNMDFTISYYLRQFWKDSRLSFDPKEYGNIQQVVLDTDQIQKLWTPGLFFRNEKGSSLSGVLTISNTLFRIYPTGEVYWSRKLDTTFGCQMRFQAYPFDAQMCPIYIGSYPFTTDIVNFSWFENISVNFEKTIELVSFELTKTEILLNKDKFLGTIGAFPGMKVIFHFKRYVSFYILEVST